MRLRDVAKQLLIDPRKCTEYALNPNSPIGKDKSVMFRQYLGFTQENYQPLLEQIQAQAMDAEANLGISDEHGQRYQVDLEIRGMEAGQQEIVRTGWIVRSNEDIARLVTLYVRRRK
ncbi:MAG: DUF6883 domain-containing protein [Limnoraphis sp.]